MSGATPPTAQPSAQEEVMGLDKVLTRLALTEDAVLEKVLTRLVPVVLTSLKSPHEATRKKVMEILGHVNKRLKGAPAVKLPLTELLSMAAPNASGPSANPMVRSFALVYAEMAFERASPAEQIAAIPSLLLGVAGRPAQHQAICLRLATAALEHLPSSGIAASTLPIKVSSALTGQAATNGSSAGNGTQQQPGAQDKQQPEGSAQKDQQRQEKPEQQQEKQQVEERQPEQHDKPQDMQQDQPEKSQASGSGPQASKGEGRTGDPDQQQDTASSSSSSAAGGGSQGQKKAPPCSPEALVAYPFLGVDADRRMVLAHLLRLLLYVPRPSSATSGAPGGARSAVTPLSLGQAALGAAPPAPEGPALPPPGLSNADVAALAEKNGAVNTGEVLSKRKLGALALVSGAGLPPSTVLLHYLVAACDPSDPVSRRGEELLRRHCGTEGPRPSLDLESDSPLVFSLFSLFHGYNESLPGCAGTLPDFRAQPASAAVRSRILGLLCRSVAAASFFPHTILTIQEAVYGSSTTGSSSARLRAQGMEFAVWVAKHAAPHQLKAMASVMLTGLLRTLEGGSGAEGSGSETAAGQAGSMDANAMTLRGFAYQTVGALAQRAPECLAGRIDVARLFFSALSEEPPGLRATVAEATSSLAAAFAAPRQTPAMSRELDELLLTSITSTRDAVRMCAVQWANRLHPFSHVEARWICVLAAADTKLEVREEGARGLRLQPASLMPVTPPPASSSAATSSVPPPSPSHSTLSKQGSEGLQVAAQKRQRMSEEESEGSEAPPSLKALLQYVHRRAPRLAAAADPSRSLPLQPRAYLALLRFAQSCWRQESSQPSLAPLSLGTPPRAAPPRVTGGDGDSEMSEAPGGQQDVSPPGLQQYEGLVPEAYLSLLEGAAARDATSELVAAGLQAVVEAVNKDPARCEARYATRLSWLRPLLGHVDGGARLAAARLLGIAAAALSPPQGVADLLSSLTSVFAPPTNTAGDAPQPTVVVNDGVSVAPVTAPTSTAPPKFEMLEGSIMAAGFVLAQAQTSFPADTKPGTTSQLAEAMRACASALSAAAQGKGPVASIAGSAAFLSATAAIALGHAGLAGSLDTLLGSSAAKPGTQPHDVAMHSSGAPLESPAAGVNTAAASMSGAAPVPAVTGSTLPTLPGTPSSTEMVAGLGQPLAALTARVLALTTDKDVKVASRAISALGLLAWGAGRHMASTPLEQPQAAGTPAAAAAVSNGSGAGHTADVTEPAASAAASAAGSKGAFLLQATAGGLVALCGSKSEDITFAAGEALAHVFGGVPLQPSAVLRTNFTSLADEFALLSPSATAPVTQAAVAAHGPEAAAMEVDSGAPSAVATSSTGADEGPGRGALRQALLSMMTEELAVHSRAEVRCAAAVWLVSLLTYCGRHPALLASLQQIQEALGGLLGDSGELTQEMASRGVSMLYSLGSEAQRGKLVESLVAVLQGTGAKSAKVKLQADTRVFEEGALGAAAPPAGGSGAAGGGGGSSSQAAGGLSTYQELCSLATELGQPDLVYKFMDLAHHQQALNTRRGAAFGFAGIAKLAGDALRPHVRTLVPKLYRYQHDPNPRVQEAMSGIWRALVDDPKQAVDDAFPLIMADLLKEMGGRLWRNRQAAASAMADLLQGRRWKELQPHLSQVWVMTFRTMDDIKESVRRAAAGLARSARGVTLRLCDPSLSSPADAREALGVVLPLLLDKGLGSSVAEVRGVSLDIIAQVAKQAQPDALKPVLPQLVQALLEGLSSFEDSRLNYIEQHADRLGLDMERLDSARTAAARASPLGDTLELAARVAGSDMGEGGAFELVLPAVTGIVRRGVGLNTKVGAARFIRSVATRAGSSIKPHAPTLLKALIHAVRGERSMVVKKAYAQAAGLICKHANDRRVGKVVAEAAEMYTGGNTNEGNSGTGSTDKDARLAAGLMFRELLRAAPEVFQNLAAASAIPLAFGAKMDEDGDVAAVWKEVWEEGASSEAGAIRMYSQEVVTFLVSGLAAPSWSRKKMCAQAVVEMTKLGQDLVSPLHSAALAGALLAEAAVPRLWDGKEAIIDAIGAVAKWCPQDLATALAGGQGALVVAALSAVGRRKTSYRTAGLRCLEACLTTFTTDYYAQVSPALVASVRTHLEAPVKGHSGLPRPINPVQGNVQAMSASGGVTAEGLTGPGVDSEDGPPPPLPLPESINCLAAAFARTDTAEALSTPVKYSGTSHNSSTGAAGGIAGPAAAVVAAAAKAGGSVTAELVAAGIPPGTAAMSPAAVAIADYSAGGELAALLSAVMSSPLPWVARLAAANAGVKVAQRSGELRSFSLEAKGAASDAGVEAAAGASATAIAAAASAATAVPELRGLDCWAQWGAVLLEGAVACAADVQVQQARVAALKCAEAALALVAGNGNTPSRPAVSAHSSNMAAPSSTPTPSPQEHEVHALTRLPPALVKKAISSLKQVLETDKGAGVAALAGPLRDRLQAVANNTPSAMEAD